MNYYCSKCGSLVFPKKLGLSYKILGMTEDFCKECGELTDTAISCHCKNGHSIDKYDKFCPKCGSRKCELSNK